MSRSNAARACLYVGAVVGTLGVLMLALSLAPCKDAAHGAGAVLALSPWCGYALAVVGAVLLAVGTDNLHRPALRNRRRHVGGW